MRLPIAPRHKGHVCTRSAHPLQQAMWKHGSKTTAGSWAVHTTHSRDAWVTIWSLPAAGAAVAADAFPGFGALHLKQAVRDAKLLSPSAGQIQSPGFTTADGTVTVRVTNTTWACCCACGAAAPGRRDPHLRHASLRPKILKLHVEHHQSLIGQKDTYHNTHPPMEKNDHFLVRYPMLTLPTVSEARLNGKGKLVCAVPKCSRTARLQGQPPMCGEHYDVYTQAMAHGGQIARHDVCLKGGCYRKVGRLAGAGAGYCGAHGRKRLRKRHPIVHEPGAPGFCYLDHCRAPPTDDLFHGRHYCAWHSAKLKKATIAEDPTPGLCNYRQCSKAAVRKAFQSTWCEQHHDEMVALRAVIRPHTNSEDELRARMKELRVRKDTDPGHQRFYLNARLNALFPPGQ